MKRYSLRLLLVLFLLVSLAGLACGGGSSGGGGASAGGSKADGGGTSMGGEYSCYNCISDRWAQEVTVIGDNPLRIGESEIRLKLDESGKVIEGKMYMEIIASPKGSCSTSRYVFDAGSASGANNQVNNILSVDFNGTETYFKSGDGCSDESRTTPMRFYFNWVASGVLVLCKDSNNPDQCRADGMAELRK